MSFDRMSTDKAITCRAVQIFCAGRQQQWLVRPLTFFSSPPIDTFPLAEKEPDGSHHFGTYFFLDRLPQSR
jgi:hypothetical protein